MKQQSFKNHKRYVPLYHFGFFGSVLVLLILGIVALACPEHHRWLIPAWLIMASLTMALGVLFGRVFALKVQDRAIRAEENLRYFILTGQRMDSRIRLRQIIALRFAGDGEFVALVKRAAEEKLEPAAIKAAIKDWREDRNRA